MIRRRSGRCCPAPRLHGRWSPAAASWPAWLPPTARTSCTLGVLTDAEARDLLARRLGGRPGAAEPAAAADLIAAVRPAAAGTEHRRRPAAARPGCRWPRWPPNCAAPGAGWTRWTPGDPATSVRTVFSWSYRDLSPPASRMFRLLGLHPGPDITAPAAASLAGMRLPQARAGAARAGRAPAWSPSTSPAGSPSTTCSAPTPPSRPAATRQPSRAGSRHRAGCSTTTCTPPPRPLLLLPPSRELVTLAPRPAGRPTPSGWPTTAGHGLVRSRAPRPARHRHPRRRGRIRPPGLASPWCWPSLLPGHRRRHRVDCGALPSAWRWPPASAWAHLPAQAIAHRLLGRGAAPAWRATTGGSRPLRPGSGAVPPAGGDRPGPRPVPPWPGRCPPAAGAGTPRRWPTLSRPCRLCRAGGPHPGVRGPSRSTPSAGTGGLLGDHAAGPIVHCRTGTGAADSRPGHLRGSRRCDVGQSSGTPSTINGPTPSPQPPPATGARIDLYPGSLGDRVDRRRKRSSTSVTDTRHARGGRRLRPARPGSRPWPILDRPAAPPHAARSATSSGRQRRKRLRQAAGRRTRDLPERRTAVIRRRWPGAGRRSGR